MMTIRPVTDSDADSWLDLRYALWPDGSESEHRGEIDPFLNGQAREPLAVQPDNRISRLAHQALGFEDVGMVVCFRKEL